MPKRSRRDSSTLANCDGPREGRWELEGKPLVREDTKLRLRAQTLLPADPLPPKTTRLTDPNSPKSRFSFSRHRHNLYIYAHDLASCNTDCCWTYGNLGDAVRLRDREFNGSLLHLVWKPSLSGEACRSRDPYPYQVSQQSLHGDWKARFSRAIEAGFFCARAWFTTPGFVARMRSCSRVPPPRREISLRQVPPQVDWVPDRVPARSAWQNLFASGAICTSGGYTQRRVEVITAIDAEMILLEK
jgi:hypothetical protein